VGWGFGVGSLVCGWGFGVGIYGWVVWVWENLTQCAIFIYFAICAIITCSTFACAIYTFYLH